MKKSILATLLALLFAFTLAVPAFAAERPNINGEVQIPEDTEVVDEDTIADGPVTRLLVKTVYVPESVTEIKAGAFDNYPNLEEIIITGEEGDVEIEDGAIPEDVTLIYEDPETGETHTATTKEAGDEEEETTKEKTTKKNSKDDDKESTTRKTKKTTARDEDPDEETSNKPSSGSSDDSTDKVTSRTLSDEEKSQLADAQAYFSKLAEQSGSGGMGSVPHIDNSIEEDPFDVDEVEEDPMSEDELEALLNGEEAEEGNDAELAEDAEEAGAEDENTLVSGNPSSRKLRDVAMLATGAVTASAIVLAWLKFGKGKLHLPKRKEKL